jgi:hypothetical protein
MDISFRKDGDSYIFLSADGVDIAKITTPDGIRDELSLQAPGVVHWKRTSTEPKEHMAMDIIALYKPIHTMIPSVSYDGNGWGGDHEYVGYSYEGAPYTFAYHRCAVSAATASQGEKFSIALYADKGEKCSCSMEPGEDACEHRLIWPEIEGPRVLGAGYWAQPHKESMQAKNTFSAYICIGGGESKNSAWKLMLNKAWEQNKHEVRAWYNAEKVWSLGVEYAKTLWTREDDGFEGFDIGLYWDEDKDGWEKNEDNKYEIGWCGQNASYAISLIYDYKKTGDKDSLNKGVGVLDSWIKHAKSEQGHLLTHYAPHLKRVIDACNLGTYALELFSAYDVLQTIDIDKPEYLEAAYKICAFAMERQNEDGSLAKSWNQDGSVDQPEGTIGAFLIPPLIEAYNRQGEQKYMVAAIKGYEYYFGEFNDKGYTTAGALDTYCIDKESAMPILKAALMLHDITGNKRYLDDAQDAAWYLATWQWHQSVDYPEGSILKDIDYDTFGGTSVSTAHHHIDPYALYYFHDYALLAKKTGQDQWIERARAIWDNATQGISDGGLCILGHKRPRGSQDEGFLHTRWHRKGVEDFGVSNWLVAWPGALRLEVLRELSDWNSLD